MSHAIPQSFHRHAAMTVPDAGAEAVALRLLRHQTKNALQRIIAQLAATDLRSTPAGEALADEIERRICLSARISDALFGFTSSPAPMRARLASLAEATVALLAAPEQTIKVEVAVSGECLAALEGTIVQVAHEMVSNAVKHGMHVRLVGAIVVQLRTYADGRASLQVSDDGWGPAEASSGEGLPIMRSLAAAHGGAVSLARRRGWTVATLDLPGR